MAPPSETASAMEWGECVVPAAPVPRELAHAVRRQVGPLPGWVERVAPVPWVAHACARLARPPVAYTTPELLDLIALVVSRDNSCRYCYGIQRAVLRILGYRDASLDRLERALDIDTLGPHERSALEFARKVSNVNPRPSGQDLLALEQKGLSSSTIAEVAFLAASTVAMNRIATLLALPPEPLESLVDRPLVRWLRPILALFVRPRRGRPVPPPLPNDGPGAAVVAALGGSPTAPLLRSVIDDAWASPVLPWRTKTLMLAVVGRALGCGHAEKAARSGLAEHGLDATEVDRILAHLASPALDRREALLLPFARESVRYQNLAIQERVRELSGRLRNEEVLEAVGVAAIANMLCRLSVLLDRC